MYIYNGRLFSVYRFAEVVNKFLNIHNEEEGKIDICSIHDTSLLCVCDFDGCIVISCNSRFARISEYMISDGHE